MAKISFSKLNLKKNEDIITIPGQEGLNIEVKKYLPVQKKLELISNVINKAIDNSNKFPNPGQIQVFFILEIFYNYTNISFTEKQKEDFAKTYDLINSSGLASQVLNAIPEEVNQLSIWLKKCVKGIYKYTNSARAILESLQTDYNNLNFDLEALQNKVQDPEMLDLLKQILPALG